MLIVSFDLLSPAAAKTTFTTTDNILGFRAHFLTTLKKEKLRFAYCRPRRATHRKGKRGAFRFWMQIPRFSLLREDENPPLKELMGTERSGDLTLKYLAIFDHEAMHLAGSRALASLQLNLAI